jgi:hypothetical protein
MRPLSNDLSWIVLASAGPAAWVAAAAAAYVNAPGETSALLLLTGLMALIAGSAVSILMARDLKRALEDLAAQSRLASREQPLNRLQPALRELAAISDGLAATSARLAASRTRPYAAAADWRWDLATGAMDWSAAATLLFRIEGTASRARLVALAHPANRAALVAWLGVLARGEDAAPCEFRIARGDGTTRMIRAAATIDRDTTGVPVAITGSFADLGPEPQETAPAADSAVNAMLQALAAKLRQRARAAGVEFGAAIMPELGPAPGAADKLAAALDLLGEQAVTFTPRGGRVLLRADKLGSGAVRIALACDRQHAPDGMELAGHLVELNCGLTAAKRLEDARALAAAGGAHLSVETRDGRDIVAITLGEPAPARRAA